MTPGTAVETRLRQLADKGHRAQQQSVEDIDWQRRPGLPFWLPRRLAAWAVSQFLHGEMATAGMCRQIAPRLPSPAAQAFLETQYLDEMRHAAIYGRYAESLGGAAKITPQLAGAYDRALAWDGPVEGVILAFHCILEGESLMLQQDVRRWFPCRQFGEISDIVARDEARHVAFGRLWCQAALPTLPVADHRRIRQHLRQLWFETMNSVIRRIRPFDIINGPKPWPVWLEETWAARERELARHGLMLTGDRMATVAA
ncbi:MAG: ferritin-like domain-containing protein [Rhodospirillales bacterium]